MEATRVANCYCLPGGLIVTSFRIIVVVAGVGATSTDSEMHWHFLCPTSFRALQIQSCSHRDKPWPWITLSQMVDRMERAGLDDSGRGRASDSAKLPARMVVRQFQWMFKDRRQASSPDLCG